MLITLADEFSVMESMVKSTGPIGVAVMLLVMALICVWRYAAKPFLGELQPISANLKDTAGANKDASIAAKEAAVASKEAAEAWRETAQVTAELQRVQMQTRG